MSAPSLLIFTNSQSPLPVLFPRPRKPVLNLPALVHRSLHASLDNEEPSFIKADGTVYIPIPDTLVKHDVPTTSVPGSSSSSDKGNVVPRSLSESEVTLKVHLVAPGTPDQYALWVFEALTTLQKYKGLSEIETLLVGTKGVDYKGKGTAASDFLGCGAEGLTSDVGPVTEESVKEYRQTWDAVVGKLKETGKLGTEVKQVGGLYLPLEILRELGGAETKPKVNSLDTPDCHSLPKDYTDFAKQQGIELWAGGGGEGSDPLPNGDLHNLLVEFAALLDLPKAAFEQTIPLRADGLKYDAEPKSSVAVRWVITYTLISRSRNLLQDKGHIVAADI